MFDALEQKWKQTEQVCDASPAPSSLDANPQPMRSLHQGQDKRPNVRSNVRMSSKFEVGWVMACTKQRFACFYTQLIVLF